MSRRLAIATAITVSACGHLGVQYKGPPRDVTVVRTASPSRFELLAVRRDASAIELVGRETSDVTATRTVRHAIGEVQLVSSNNPATEVVELFIGVMMLAFAPVTLEADDSTHLQESADQHLLWSRARYVGTLLDPTRSLIGAELALRVPDEPGFADPPQTLSYSVHLPAAGRHLHYRALDAGQRSILEGDATLDAFGSATIDGASDAIVALAIDGRVVAIDRAPELSDATRARWKSEREQIASRDAARTRVIAAEATESPLVTYDAEPPAAKTIHDYRAPSWRAGFEVAAGLAILPMATRITTPTVAFDEAGAVSALDGMATGEVWPYFSRRVGIGLVGSIGGASGRATDLADGSYALWGELGARTRIGLGWRLALGVEYRVGARRVVFDHSDHLTHSHETGDHDDLSRRGGASLELCLDGAVRGLRVFGYGGYCGFRVTGGVALDSLDGRDARVYQLGIYGHWFGRLDVSRSYPVVGSTTGESAVMMVAVVGKGFDWFGGPIRN